MYLFIIAFAFMLRLLLWDCDNRSYSYYIEVAGNTWDWTVVADKTRESCRSWQTIYINPPRPIVYIRIVGTHNTANEVSSYTIKLVISICLFTGHN